jgi:DNA invertase Pin-like site-specific DNA recombinase
MLNDATTKRRFVSYLRVSTDKQGAKGLGMEAQRQAVETFLKSAGKDAVLIAEFVEVESGRKSDKERPMLAKALERCSLTGAMLVIAKLDRLSRDAHFLLGLKKAEVAFVCCDNPHADRFIIGILAMVAEQEAKAISERTKAALWAAKSRGVKLGNPNGAEHLAGRGNVEAVRAITARADCKAAKLRGQVEAIRAEGHSTLTAIAAELTRRGIVTPRGGAWHPMGVKRLLNRMGSHVGQS